MYGPKKNLFACLHVKFPTHVQPTNLFVDQLTQNQTTERRFYITTRFHIHLFIDLTHTRFISF